MGLLKFLFTAILVYWGIKLVFRLLAMMGIVKVMTFRNQRPFGYGQQAPPKRNTYDDGNVYIPEQQADREQRKPEAGDDGEYIDYEEVK